MKAGRRFFEHWPVIPAGAALLLIMVGHKSAYVFGLGLGYFDAYLLCLGVWMGLLPLLWLFAGWFVGDRPLPRGFSQVFFFGFLASPVFALLLMMMAKGAGAILTHHLGGQARSSCYDLVGTDGRYYFRLRPRESGDAGDAGEVVLRVRSMYFAVWSVKEGEPVLLRWKSTPVGDRLLELRPEPGCGTSR